MSNRILFKFMEEYTIKYIYIYIYIDNVRSRVKNIICQKLSFDVKTKVGEEICVMGVQNCHSFST